MSSLVPAIVCVIEDCCAPAAVGAAAKASISKYRKGRFISRSHNS
jgi:hypothetical protein